MSIRNIISEALARQIIDNDAFLDMDQETYDRIYYYYLSSGEMPYGVAKARDGDPHQWMYEQIEKEFGH